ncbi:unnamed protein product [Ilex paraguariensis]|uniref:Uncharacterized protein n=1 Tax=Ilex paraguariensis TaxID=185542 RepID=A0ABC8UX22_9AQUA
MMVQYPKNSTDFVLSGATKYSEIIDENSGERSRTQGAEEMKNQMNLPQDKRLDLKRKMSPPVYSDDKV